MLVKKGKPTLAIQFNNGSINLELWLCFVYCTLMVMHLSMLSPRGGEVEQMWSI